MHATATDHADQETIDDDVHVARCSGGLVLLDIIGDSYSCLYDLSLSAADRSADQMTPDAPADDAVDAPEQHGDHPGHGGMVADMPPPTWRDPAPIDQLRIGPGDVGRFLLALLWAGWSYRRCDFAQLIARIQRHGSPAEAPANTCAVRALVAARFGRLCLWLPFETQCLFRSFFLLHFLRLHSLRADWVFGVALFPFEAHCWIADGDVLLGDRSGRVARFETILLMEKAGP